MQSSEFRGPPFKWVFDRICGFMGTLKYLSVSWLFCAAQANLENSHGKRNE